MNRTKLLLDVVRDMRSLANSIQTVCDALESDIQPESEAKHAEKPATGKTEKKSDITLEKVRAVLAEKSQAGFTTEVRGIIRSCGAEKLSGVDPKRYAEVLKAAEVLGNG